MKEFIRVLKFTFFSVSAGLIEMGAFALLNEFTALPYWPCYLVALCLSVLWNFTLNRKFTFQSAANVPVAMPRWPPTTRSSHRFLPCSAISWQQALAGTNTW